MPSKKKAAKKVAKKVAKTVSKTVDAPTPAEPVSTTALVRVGSDVWKSRTSELRQWRKKMAGDILQYRYEVGKFAIEVIEDKAKESGNRLYGTHTTQDICDAIKESPTTVHDSIKFVRKVGVKELAHLKSCEYPWRAVAALITVTDAKAYVALKEKFETGAFGNTDEFKAATTEANVQSKEDGTKTDKRGSGGSSTAAAIVKSFNTTLTQATKKLIPDLLAATKTFVKDSQTMAPATAEVVASGLHDARQNIKTVKLLFDKAEAAIDAAGVK